MGRKGERDRQGREEDSAGLLFFLIPVGQGGGQEAGLTEAGRQP